MKSVTGYKNRYKLLRRFMSCKTNRQQQIFRQGRTAGKLGIPYAELAWCICRQSLVTRMADGRHMANCMCQQSCLYQEEGKNKQKSIQGALHAFHFIGFAWKHK